MRFGIWALLYRRKRPAASLRRAFSECATDSLLTVGYNERAGHGGGVNVAPDEVGAWLTRRGERDGVGLTRSADNARRGQRRRIRIRTLEHVPAVREG